MTEMTYLLRLQTFLFEMIQVQINDDKLNKQTRTVMKLLDGENCEGLTNLKGSLLYGALKLTLPKESHDLDRDSPDFPKEFEKATTYGGNKNDSYIRIFKRRVEEKQVFLTTYS